MVKIVNKNQQLAGKVSDQGILEFVRDAYTAYGQLTIQNRALPDFRDGLKPVQRKVLWAMKDMGITFDKGYKKCARICGDTMGRFHPHGDSAIYGALVGMVNQPVPTLIGQGGFGDLFTNPAAMRYTESKLSKYSCTALLDSAYLAVIPMHPNYDGNEKEPLYLPALLPNLLLNGCRGIAVATKTDIPPFHPKGVMHLVKERLRGKTITPEMCIEHLVFNYKYGSHFVGTNDDLKTLFGKGSRTLPFLVDYTADLPKRQIHVHGLTPNFDKERIIDILEKKCPECTMSDKGGNGKYDFVFTVKASVPKDKVSDIFNKVLDLLIEKIQCHTNVTIREAEDNVVFNTTTIPKLITDWVAYRVELEEACLRYKLGKLRDVLNEQKLLFLAAQNRDIIIKSLSSSNPEKVLVTKLNISEDQAKDILEMKIRQLSKLNETAVASKIKETKSQISSIKEDISNPSHKVMHDLREVTDSLGIMKD